MSRTLPVIISRYSAKAAAGKRRHASFEPEFQPHRGDGLARQVRACDENISGRGLKAEGI
jgi:hypothetical protein